MKKLLLVLAVLCFMVVPTAVFAADPTTLTVNWGGSGVVTGSGVVGNDAAYNFATSGSAVGGDFNVVASNDNPYGYNVGTSSSYIDADVANGSIYYEANRTDGYGMYGPAGQTAASFVGVNADGIGEMATGSWNNYASMVNGTYGKPHTTNGYNYQASGTNYLIASYLGIGDAALGNGLVLSPTGNYALLYSSGTGTAKVNDMTNQMYGNGLDFGEGGGCYTNANALLTGYGTFRVGSVGTNGIQSALGSYVLNGAGSNLNITATGTGVTYGSGVATTGNGLGTTTLDVIANYGTGATVSDYSLSVW